MRPLLVVAMLAVALPASPATAVAVSVEELARVSDAVVRGRVGPGRSQWSGDRLRISTTYPLRPLQVWRGVSPPEARVSVLGGIVGRVGQRVDGSPTLAPGEEVVLFLQRAGSGTFRVIGLAQGKFAVAGPVARPDLSRLTFIRTAVRPGERRSEEMPLDELERRVRSTR